MGPRIGVDSVGGGHERFFEVPKFFSSVRFGSPRFGAPVFGPPVLDRTPVLDSTSIGPIQPPQLGTSRYLMVPHGTRNMWQLHPFYSTGVCVCVCVFVSDSTEKHNGKSDKVKNPSEH